MATENTSKQIIELEFEVLAIFGEKVEHLIESLIILSVLKLKKINYVETVPSQSFKQYQKENTGKIYTARHEFFVP